jgi:VIT1/CCC1 family predicted Fe2+/Mn2+ transporter
LNERNTTIAAQMNLLPQMIRHEFDGAVAKVVGEHQQHSTVVIEQIAALQNQMNVLPSQMRQEFVEGLAKLAGEQQREWAALEELLLNMLNQPIEHHSPERDDSHGAATGR